jgi:hypothetical protein
MLNSIGSEFLQDNDELFGNSPARIPAYSAVELATDSLAAYTEAAYNL